MPMNHEWAAAQHYK